MSITYEISVSAVSEIIEAAASAGVAPENLCRSVKLKLSTLEDVDNRIPFAQLIGLFESAARLTGDDAFGLRVGGRNSPKLYGILGYAAMNSRTFGEALNRWIRFQEIRTNAVKYSLKIIRSNVHFEYIYQTIEIPPRERRQESEETLSTILQIGRKLTGVDWIPLEVHFEHDPPENTTEHKRIFQSPVRFNKPRTKLIFDKSVMGLSIAEADLTLGSLLERQAGDLLAKLSQQGTFANEVRQLIREGLPDGEARMATVCLKLGNSTRTLQRKLRDENTSFQELLEETQREMSEFYLHNPELAICEISYLLGFSQPSVFHRAFRRWTGLTPKAFRHKQHRQLHR